MKPLMLDGVPVDTPKAGDVYLGTFADDTKALLFLVQERERLRVIWVGSENTDNKLYLNSSQYAEELWDHKYEKYTYLGTLQGASLLNKLTSSL